MDCIFCKIVNREIKSAIVYEDKEVMAFLDIAPVNKGHLLIMPKKHFETFLDLDKETMDKVMVVTQKVAKALVKAVNANGFNILLNNKKAAGQLVDHVHFHIIPRLRGDGLRHWSHGKYEENEIEEVAKMIRNSL